VHLHGVARQEAESHAQQVRERERVAEEQVQQA
jgi:hypothetical protein